MNPSGLKRSQDIFVAGNPSSGFQVVAYEDLQCPDCEIYHTMLREQVLPQFGDRAAFIFKDFPLPRHDWAIQAAVAARFLASRNVAAAMEFRRLCLFHREAISGRQLNDVLKNFAEDHSMDPDEVALAVTEPEYRAAVDQDIEEAQSLKITNTPTVLVDKVRFVEQFPVKEFMSHIKKGLRAYEKALAKKK